MLHRVNQTEKDKSHLFSLILQRLDLIYKFKHIHVTQGQSGSVGSEGTYIRKTSTVHKNVIGNSYLACSPKCFKAHSAVCISALTLPLPSRVIKTTRPMLSEFPVPAQISPALPSQQKKAPDGASCISQFLATVMKTWQWVTRIGGLEFEEVLPAAKGRGAGVRGSCSH